jgi:hypothetical protein
MIRTPEVVVFTQDVIEPFVVDGMLATATEVPRTAADKRAPARPARYVRFIGNSLDRGHGGRCVHDGDMPELPNP